MERIESHEITQREWKLVEWIRTLPPHSQIKVMIIKQDNVPIRIVKESGTESILL